MTKELKTREQVKSEFIAKGASISNWANENGVDRNDVYQVLNNRTPCLRGKKHRIAVLLGIKAEEA